MKASDVAKVTTRLREHAEALMEAGTDLIRQAEALEAAYRGEPAPEPVLSAEEQKTFDGIAERLKFRAIFAGATTEAEARERFQAAQAGRRG